MSALKDTLSQATKEAMKARDKDRVATLRMVNAELKRIEVDERRELSDEDIFTVLNKSNSQMPVVKTLRRLKLTKLP
jgi:uncharacterized protein YqeY